MEQSAPTRSKGIPVSPGLVIGQILLLRGQRLAELGRQRSDEEIGQLNALLVSDVTLTLATSPHRKWGNERARHLGGMVLAGVDDLLRTEGWGLEGALASLLVRWRLPDASGPIPKDTEAGRLAEFAETLLSGLLRRRSQAGYQRPGYVALASSLTLAQAVSLREGLAGLAVDRGSVEELSTAARLLGVPAVTRLANVENLAEDGDVVRLDGAEGTLDVIARLGARRG